MLLLLVYLFCFKLISASELPSDLPATKTAATGNISISKSYLFNVNIAYSIATRSIQTPISIQSSEASRIVSIWSEEISSLEFKKGKRRYPYWFRVLYQYLLKYWIIFKDQWIKPVRIAIIGYRCLSHLEYGRMNYFY